MAMSFTRSLIGLVAPLVLAIGVASSTSCSVILDVHGVAGEDAEEGVEGEAEGDAPEPDVPLDDPGAGDADADLPAEADADGDAGRCGDAVVQAGEDCDDGNTDPDDGWFGTMVASAHDGRRAVPGWWVPALRFFYPPPRPARVFQVAFAGRPAAWRRSPPGPP
jgi:hypothetical protein